MHSSYSGRTKIAILILTPMAYMAAGFGGQYIFVVPGLDLVMVSTADTSSDTIDRHMQAFNLLTQYVIPAIKSVTDQRVSGAPRIDRVVNGASYAGGIAPGGWASIFGANLSTSTRGWREDDFAGANLPVQLDGLSVTVGGKPSYVAYASPEQINVLVPAGVSAGSATVNIVVAPGYSAAATAEVRDAAPALFLWKNKFAVAQHADYTPVGGAALLPEIQATPAEPGETIVLYGTGFGSTGIAGGIGELARQAMPLATLPSVSIGGTAAKVEYAGIPEGSAGLYQINVTVPESAADGDLQLTVDYGEAEAPPALLSVKRRPNGLFQPHFQDQTGRRASYNSPSNPRRIAPCVPTCASPCECFSSNLDSR